MRELKKASRPIIKRMAEASARPAAIGSLKEVINMSSYFLTQMKNFSNSSEVESIFTEVEITTLEALLNETKVNCTHFVIGNVLWCYIGVV